MLRVLGVIAAACAATVCAAPAGAAELTPDGPATLMNRWTGVSTTEGRSPAVLVGVRVVVGEGGRAGTVRVRVKEVSSAPSVAGDPVVLPAEPGTYTFPAPHVPFDSRVARLGIDQFTGGHEIVVPQPCTPERGPYGDLCQVSWLDVFAGDPPPGADGTPTESRGGTPLAISGVAEADNDRDLRGDLTEDRTDLRVSATTIRGADNFQHTAIVLTNAGPLPADLPVLTEKLPPGRTGSWVAECLGTPWPLPSDGCRVAPLSPGAARTVTLRSDVAPGDAITVSARAEGSDLAGDDNTVTVIAAGAPAPKLAQALAVSATRKQSLRRGLRLRLSATTTGKARVTATFNVKGRAIRLARTVGLTASTPRTITLRAHGAKLRTLRRAARRGPLRARIAVREPGGKIAAEATTLVS